MTAPTGSLLLHGETAGHVPLWVVLVGLALALGTTGAVYCLVGLVGPEEPSSGDPSRRSRGSA